MAKYPTKFKNKMVFLVKMQADTILVSIDDALFKQFSEFDRLHRTSGLVPAFDIFQGNGCLRVDIHYPSYPSRFVDYGYAPETFGLGSEAQLSEAIINYLTKELHLSKKKHRTSNE